MKKNLSKLTALSLALVMILGLFAGCGSQSDNQTSQAPNNGDQPSAPVVTENTDATVVEDIELNVGFATGIESMTPFRNNIAQDAPYFRQMYESLGILDHEAKEVVPWCAKGWTTEDGKVYDIELYDYITDSAGNKITADDIVWFMQTSIEKGLKPAFAKIESVEKTGDYTLRVTMNTNIVGAFETCLINTFVISRAAFEASKDEFASEVVCTSPYQVTSFTPSSDIVFERRDEGYWQTDESLIPAQCVPNVKKLTYKIITEASQQGVALETGVVDMFVRMDSTTGATYVNNPNFVCDLTEGPQGWTLFFSGADNRPVANDPKLCQAICYAIDLEGMMNALSGGYATKMYDVCPSGAIGYLSKWDSEEYFNYDADKAKQLLSESNYNGETLELLCSSATFNQRMAQMIQGFLINVGINCELVTGDMAFISSVRLDGTKYDMFINTIGATYLSDHWSIRYDMNAYSTGDGTSRHDETLADMLYSTWTKDGYTEENIDAVHKYLMDNGIARGLLNPQNFCVMRSDLKIVKKVTNQAGEIAIVACEYGK